MSQSVDFLLGQVEKKVKEKDEVCVCEIGSGKGETARKIMALLRQYDRYYYFDYRSATEDLKKELEGKYPAMSRGYGNSRKTYDSYAWSLQKLYFLLADTRESPRIFDVVYLDASNIFLHDAAYAAILKMMMKPDAVIVINNTSWTFGKSKYWNPASNPETSKMLSEEQIGTSQDDVVAKLFFESDREYERIADGKGGFKAFKKTV